MTSVTVVLIAASGILDLVPEVKWIRNSRAQHHWDGACNTWELGHLLLLYVQPVPLLVTRENQIENPKEIQGSILKKIFLILLLFFIYIYFVNLFTSVDASTCWIGESLFFFLFFWFCLLAWGGEEALDTIRLYPVQNHIFWSMKRNRPWARVHAYHHTNALTTSSRRLIPWTYILSPWLNLLANWPPRHRRRFVSVNVLL